MSWRLEQHKLVYLDDIIQGNTTIRIILGLLSNVKTVLGPVLTNFCARTSEREKQETMKLVSC